MYSFSLYLLDGKIFQNRMSVVRVLSTKSITLQVEYCNSSNFVQYKTFYILH